MADFLTTHATAYHLERVLTEAAERVVLVSPYWRLSKTFAQRLMEVGERRVPVTLVYGKSELAADQRAQLAAVPRLQLFYLEHLHAKCYFNERAMVITSMNMYEYSEKTNREMGVLLAAGEPAYAAAAREVDSILAAAEARPMPTPRVAAGASRVATRSGYCIRCRTAVPCDPARPLCHDCWSVWTAYENPEYVEQACHRCGSAARTSFARPLCASCQPGAARTWRRFTLTRL